MIKRLSLFVFLLSFFEFKAQECGTKFSQEYRNKHFQNISSLNGALGHDTCLHKTLSIYFHIVLDSSGQTGVPSTDLDLSLDQLNNLFKPICLSFRNCLVDSVPDYNYNKWDQDLHEPTFVPNYYVDSVINIVLVETITNPAGKAGYAHAPGGIDMIVIQKGDIANFPVAVHEMGHFFGLLHTFDAVAGTELVNESNCVTAGDHFCDTEADPYPTGKDPNSPCGFKYGPVDANGDYYLPPVDNIMTYFQGCQCRFTQEQYNYMAYIYATERNYLH